MENIKLEPAVGCRIVLTDKETGEEVAQFRLVYADDKAREAYGILLGKGHHEGVSVYGIMTSDDLKAKAFIEPRRMNASQLVRLGKKRGGDKFLSADLYKSRIAFTLVPSDRDWLSTLSIPADEEIEVTEWLRR